MSRSNISKGVDLRGYRTKNVICHAITQQSTSLCLTTKHLREKQLGKESLKIVPHQCNVCDISLNYRSKSVIRPDAIAIQASPRFKISQNKLHGTLESNRTQLPAPERQAYPIDTSKKDVTHIEFESSKL